MKLALHNYWRSSSSHRVRIGLSLKGLAYEYVVVNILKAEQAAETFRTRNPMAQVPVLEVTEDDGTVHELVQSLPILEYLDERWSERPLLPKDLYLRAKVRALAEIINSGIQPHQNLGTMRKVKEIGGDAANWPTSFIADGLVAFERAVNEVAGAYCVGDAPTLADCFLVPQLLSARRFGIEVSRYPLLAAIEERCNALPAFADAHPDRQPDAVK